jgi:hypothetical protein
MFHPLRLVLALVVFSFLVTSAAFACKCAAQGSVKSSVDGSAAVFTGLVLKIEYFGLSETINPDSLTVARMLPHESSKNFLDAPMVLKATMLVTSDFKGVTKKDTVVVYTGIRGATCGFKFEPNKEYTVYATNDNYLYMFLRLDRQRFKNFTKKGVYWTSICSRTTVAVGREQGLLNEHFARK